jgi:hypothetical protein
MLENRLYFQSPHLRVPDPSSWESYPDDLELGLRHLLLVQSCPEAELRRELTLLRHGDQGQSKSPITHPGWRALRFLYSEPKTDSSSSDIYAKDRHKAGRRVWTSRYPGSICAFVPI